MYEYFVQNPVVAIIFLVIMFALFIFLVVKFVQHVGLEKIRLYAYKWFEDAEDEFLYGENTQKFEHVVQLARSAIPSPFNLFVTERVLRKTIQLWFDLCKDYLDDKKLNGSGKRKGEEE